MHIDYTLNIITLSLQECKENFHQTWMTHPTPAFAYRFSSNELLDDAPHRRELNLLHAKKVVVLFKDYVDFLSKETNEVLLAHERAHLSMEHFKARYLQTEDTLILEEVEADRCAASIYGPKRVLSAMEEIDKHMLNIQFQGKFSSILIDMMSAIKSPVGKARIAALENYGR